MWHTPNNIPKWETFKLYDGQGLSSHIFCYNLFCNIYFPVLIRVSFYNKLDQNCGTLYYRKVVSLITLPYFPFLVSLLLLVYSFLLIRTAIKRILCLCTE